MKNLPINALKSAFVRSGKFAMAFIALITCMVMSPAALYAQSGDDSGQTRTPDGMSVFNEDYFKNIHYSWTDENGVARLSNLAEPATEYNQIVAFIREVYLNPNVPGFIKDYAWNPSLDDPKYPNTFVDVPYEPCLAEGNPYGMTASTVVPKPIEGTTALMVELVDDYVFHLGDSCEELIKKIKRITLLTNQRYVDETVSANNPGTLFNYVGALNNFFLVTKGNNRLATDPTKKEGFPPFYNMFEEYSPSNKLPIYNAFQDMDAGHGFSVDHNCTSIMGQNHIIVMSPEPEKDKPIDEELYHDYGVNFMFFLPDLRFARDTRKHPDQSVTDYDGEWYTFYSAEHRPYFFFNKIKATINNDPEVVDKGGESTAKVKVTWNSTYNDIVHYQANEDFYVYRVVNDVIEEVPLNLKKMIEQGLCEIIEPDEYTLNEDGSITAKADYISVYFYEPLNRFAYNVNYIVTGRRYLTGFEFTESNVVSNTIPGLVDPPGSLNIVIEGEHKSEHKIAEQRNYYKHTIKMLDSNPEFNKVDNVTLAKMHLRATSEADVVTGTTFKLMRYVGDSKETATEIKHIATLEITNAYTDQWHQWLYDYEITDVATNKKYGDAEHPLPEKPLFKTPIYYTDAQMTQEDAKKTNESLVVAPADAKGILATFYDIFSVDTSKGEHPDMYHYYIDYEPAVLAGGEEVDYNADSNVVDFLVPHNNLKAGYVPYSIDQIQAEQEFDTRLPENSPGLQFSTTTNPNVESYTVYRMADASTPVRVAKATRMPTGRLSIERATGPSSALKYCSSSYKQQAPIVEVPAAAALTNNEYVLVVKYNNGNSFGNRVTNLYDLPRPVIQYIRVSADDEKTNGDETKYVGWILWHTEGFGSDRRNVMSANDAAASFHNAGYRVWRKRHGSDMTEDYENQSKSIIYEDIESDEKEGTGPASVMARSNAGETTVEVLEDGSIYHREPFTAHVCSLTNPVKYEANLRLYTRLPEEMSISEGSDPGYVVADTSDRFHLTTYKMMTLGIESVDGDNADANAPVEYYNLQGQRIHNPQPGNIVIRRQGSKVSKILYR